MADFRLRRAEDEHMTPDRSNCAVVVGYEGQLTDGKNLPLAYVPIGEAPEGKCTGAVSDPHELILSHYGFLLAASKIEDFPMPPSIKEALMGECSKCKNADNCYVFYNLEIAK